MFFGRELFDPENNSKTKKVWHAFKNKKNAQNKQTKKQSITKGAEKKKMDSSLFLADSHSH
jgi:hypothetical protein